MHNCFEPQNVPANIKIIVPSHFTHNWFRERLPEASIEVVRNGFDGDIYSLPSDIKREDIGLNKNNNVILFAGRITRDKGCLS